MNALAAMWMALGLLPVPLTEESTAARKLADEAEVRRAAEATERLERRQRQLAQRRERKGLR